MAIAPMSHSSTLLSLSMSVSDLPSGIISCSGGMTHPTFRRSSRCTGRCSVKFGLVVFRTGLTL